MTLSWALKPLVTRVFTLFSLYLPVHGTTMPREKSKTTISSTASILLPTWYFLMLWQAPMVSGIWRASSATDIVEMTIDGMEAVKHKALPIRCAICKFDEAEISIYPHPLILVNIPKSVLLICYLFWYSHKNYQEIDITSRYPILTLICNRTKLKHPACYFGRNGTSTLENSLSAALHWYIDVFNSGHSVFDGTFDAEQLLWIHYLSQ